MLRHLRFAVPVLGALALAPLDRVEAQSAQLGLMAGASLATFTGDVTDDLENNTTFLVGGFARLSAGGFTIEPGLAFTRKGTKFSESGAEVKNNLDYVQVPVVFTIGAPIGSGARFYMGAGPALGIKVGCTFRGSVEGFSASTDCEEFEDGDEGGIRPKSTEFSGIGVAGVEFGKISIGLRADIGLTNAYDVFLGDLSVEPDLKTRTLSAVVAVRF